MDIAELRKRAIECEGLCIDLAMEPSDVHELIDAIERKDRTIAALSVDNARLREDLERYRIDAA